MRRYLICFILLAYVLNASSQIPYFQKYSLLKKSQPVQVNKMYQDSVGFIWYGTNHGLFKFDGLHFVNYTERDSLPDINVTALAEDSLGRMWMGHRNGKISFFANNVIVKFKTDEGDSNAEISDMVFDNNGVLWFGTQGDGLYYYTNNRLYRIDEEDGLPDLFIYDLQVDHYGVIWAATDGGVVKCRLDKGNFTIEVYNSDNSLPDNIIKKLAVDEKNMIWLATEDNGVLEFNPVDKKWKTRIKPDNRFGTFTDFVIIGEQVWAATTQSGIVGYNRASAQEKVYAPHDVPLLTSITSLLSDAEDNVWIGTKTGVVRFNGDNIEFISEFNGSQSSNVLDMTFDHDSNLWISTNSGLFKQTKENGKIGYKNPLVNTPYRDYTIISLYTDIQGYIWAGLFGEGLLRINPKTNKIFYLNKELRNGNVLNITGKDNSVWVATLGGGTSISIENEKINVKNYSSAEGLISDYIYQVFIDSRNRIWFGTDGKGVDMLDGGTFHHYEKDFTTSKVIYGFAEDSQGTIWINVQGEGLYKYNGHSFVPATDVKLRDNTISAMATTSTGDLVVMNELGLDFIDVKLSKVRSLTSEMNMTTRKGNLNAITKDKFGRIYFGTDEGVVSYSGRSEHVHPKPFIDKLKILNRESFPYKNMVLNYKENNITINFHGFWFQSPEELNYKYTLINYDQEWISTRDRSVTYSSLPPGEYTFRVMVSDSDDFDTASEAVYHFSIQPPFWRTYSFYARVFVVTVFLGYSYMKFRESKLVRDKQILEEKVSERTKEIQIKNEEINAQAEEIRGINENLEMLVKERTSELEKKNRALEESAFIIAHELRAPVASILGLINLISKTDLSDKEKEIVSHMDESAEKLNTIVRTITKAIERGDSVRKPES